MSECGLDVSRTYGVTRTHISYFPSGYSGLVLITESGDQEEELDVQGLQGLGLDLVHHPFQQTLLTKANHKPSPDLRGRKISSTSSWQDLQIYIAMSIDTGG